MADHWPELGTLSRILMCKLLSSNDSVLLISASQTLAWCLAGHQYMYALGPNTLHCDGFYFKKLRKPLGKLYFFLKEKSKELNLINVNDFAIII